MLENSRAEKKTTVPKVNGLGTPNCVKQGKTDNLALEELWPPWQKGAFVRTKLSIELET